METHSSTSQPYSLYSVEVGKGDSGGIAVSGVVFLTNRNCVSFCHSIVLDFDR